MLFKKLLNMTETLSWAVFFFHPPSACLFLKVKQSAHTGGYNVF